MNFPIVDCFVAFLLYRQLMVSKCKWDGSSKFLGEWNMFKLKVIMLCELLQQDDVINLELFHLFLFHELIVVWFSCCIVH